MVKGPVLLLQIADATSSCTFCTVDEQGLSQSFDLSSVSSLTWRTTGSLNPKAEYFVTSPCAAAEPWSARCGPPDEISDPVSKGSQWINTYGCSGLGTLAGSNATFAKTARGLNITLAGGRGGTSVTYQFLCDPSSSDSIPDGTMIEDGSHFTVTWRHPSVCKSVSSSEPCGPAPPAPAPRPYPSPLPGWKPTWSMWRSTMLYTCNTTGMHDVSEAIKYGFVSYDWSNAKDIWVNDHPMDTDKLLTQQAEAVLAAEPGVPGEQPRVWVYRNTIKALNWYSSVQEKLDDPNFAGWFVRFKDYKGPVSNNSYHVPACDWAPPNPKCSGFYHDQEQTPEHPGGGSAYRVDGACTEQCDCGPVNPCGEYMFDHRNESFRNWFINEYMLGEMTVRHKPAISLGILDDYMTITGPSESDVNFMADTGATDRDMQDHMRAYYANMNALSKATLEQGFFSWLLVGGFGPQVSKWGGQHFEDKDNLKPRNVSAEQCARILREQYCTDAPSAWNVAHFYKVWPDVALSNATDLTAEFLVTRGPYAWLGYDWVGCTSETRPRPSEWDEDYGEPMAPCSETATGSKVFSRTWSKAVATWDCNIGSGSITSRPVII